jgi:NDP-sugar pyrophosphorylase family protein
LPADWRPLKISPIPITTAFVLGAGLGARLRPLTNVCPKPLIPVCNKPLIAWSFDHLLAHGVERFVVNTHWRAEVFAQEFPKGVYKGAPISFRHEAPDVLETAGGIKNVEDLLGNEPFIVYNGDILCDFSLHAAVEAHRIAGNEVTLVLRSKDGPLQIAFDEGTSRIVDIGGRIAPANESRFLFTGIYVVSPAFLSRIPPATKMSVVPIFIEMIRMGAKLGGIVCDDGHWWDLGSREQYLSVHRFLAGSSESIGRPPWISADARVAADVQLSGATAIGPGASVGAGARLHDCLLWPGAEIAAESDLEACIVTGATPVSGRHAGADL